MHAARLLGIMRPWVEVSSADAACTSMGSGVENDLVDRRGAPDLDIGSDERFNARYSQCLFARRDISLRHSLALCICKLCEEARGSVGLSQFECRVDNLVLYTSFIRGGINKSITGTRLNYWEMNKRRSRGDIWRLSFFTK